jgi:hypothetical protein
MYLYCYNILTICFKLSVNNKVLINHPNVLECHNDIILNYCINILLALNFEHIIKVL